MQMPRPTEADKERFRDLVPSGAMSRSSRCSATSAHS